MNLHGRILRNVALACVVVVALLAVGTSALARDGAGRTGADQGWKGLGLRAYWSVLREDQKSEAKAIVADHLARTAPDRWAAAARAVQFRADVAAMLTPVQRKAAGRLAWARRHTPHAKRMVALARLLDETDRTALADEVASLASAAPADKVKIGLGIHGRLFDLVEPKLAVYLDLTSEQRSQLRELYAGLMADLGPIALRLETAKAEDARRGLALLDDEQRATLKDLGAGITEKVLAFLRG